MAIVTVVVGIILDLVGIISYTITEASSWTALIPAIIGTVLVILGVVASRERLRKHAIHAALVVALLGVLGSAPNVLGLGELVAGTAERPVAVVASTITFLVLLVYIALGVRSFIAARRARRAEQAV